MSYDVFPDELLWPDSSRWSLKNAAFSGGITETQSERLAVTSGGGKWFCDITVPLIDDAGYALSRMVKLARAIVIGCDGGATPILVPYMNENEAPYPLGVPGGTVPFSDGSTFSDGSEFESGSINVTLAAALLRATQVTIEAGAVVGDIIGGEMFSVVYPNKDEHMHVITRVGTALTVRPPWREATPAGTPANFDRPKCLMILTNADEALEAIVPPYQSRLTLNFRELI